MQKIQCQNHLSSKNSMPKKFQQNLMDSQYNGLDQKKKILSSWCTATWNQIKSTTSSPSIGKYLLKKKKKLSVPHRQLFKIEKLTSKKALSHRESIQFKSD